MKKIAVNNNIKNAVIAVSILTLAAKLFGFAENKNYSSLNPAAQVLATQLFGADNNGGSSSLPNPTSVRVGAALAFGGLRIDGLLGANGALVNFNEFFYRAAILYDW